MVISRCDVQMMLMDMGVPMQLDGYKYIVDAILMTFESDMKVSKRLHRYVYPSISKKYNVSEASVERAIRYAVKMTIRQMPLSRFRTLFSAGAKSVSVSTFIGSAIQYIDTNCTEDPLTLCSRNFINVTSCINKNCDPKTVALYTALQSDMSDLKKQAIQINERCAKIMKRLNTEDRCEND